MAPSKSLSSPQLQRLRFFVSEAPGWTFKTFNLSAGSPSKTPAEVALHCFVHMEEVKKQRGSCTKCIKNQSSLIQASLLNILNCWGCFEPHFCRHALTPQLQLPNESKWIQLTLTSDALSKCTPTLHWLAQGCCMICSPSPQNYQGSKALEDGHLYIFSLDNAAQMATNCENLPQSTRRSILCPSYTRAHGCPSSLWNFQLQTKVAILDVGSSQAE